METRGTIYICDECNKQAVSSEYDPQAHEGWISTQNYTSYDRLALTVGEVDICVSLNGKHFCSTPCLTFHIGKVVKDGLEKAIEEKALEEKEEAGKEAEEAGKEEVAA